MWFKYHYEVVILKANFRLGPGCFVTSQSCASEGTIVNVTQDTVTVEYECSGNTGCYCEDDSSTLVLFVVYILLSYLIFSTAILLEVQ